MAKKQNDLKSLLAPTPLPWEAFEAEVAEYVVKVINNRQLGIDGDRASVIPKCPLFSKERGSEIIFDIAIKVFSAPDPDTPSLVWLWECKDYPSNRVGVNEIEEFCMKLHEVGAHKGTIVTRVGFQRGGVALLEGPERNLHARPCHCLTTAANRSGRA